MRITKFNLLVVDAALKDHLCHLRNQLGPYEDDPDFRKHIDKVEKLSARVLLAIEKDERDED